MISGFWRAVAINGGSSRNCTAALLIDRIFEALKYMDSDFWVKLGLSFLVGGAWVTVSSLAAGKFGSKIGGLISGYPSTVVVALLFIGLTQDRQMVFDATTVMPAAMGTNGFFVISFIYLARWGLGKAIAGALLAWTAMATALIILDPQIFIASIICWFLFISLFYLIVEKGMTIASQDRIVVHNTFSHILWRGLMGGGVIAVAVLLSKIGGPVFGGVFAVFPAIFLSTLIITHQMGGASFSRAMGKSMVISGMINVGFYGVCVRYLYTWFDIWPGTGIALLVSCGTVFLTYLFIRTRLS